MNTLTKMLGSARLKVNIKSLAAESKIIRKSESKIRNTYIRGDLNFHRRGPLREESRYSQLAYACVRGIPYSKVESKTQKTVDWNRVQRKVLKLCDSWQMSKIEVEKHIQSWIDDGARYWCQCNP